MKYLEEIIYALDKNIDADFWIKELKEWRDQAVSAHDEEWREKIESFKLTINERRVNHHKDCLTDMFINGKFWEDVEIENLLRDLISSMK